MATDQEFAHFISEHYTLFRWVFKITNLMARKTVEHYRDEESAYAALLISLNKKGLCGDVEGTRQALKGTLMTLEINSGPVLVTEEFGEDAFRHGFNMCPFSRRD